MRGFWPNSQGSNKENWHQGHGNQGQKYGNYNREGHYVRSGPYVPPQNWEFAPRDGGGSMARVEDILQKMMRRFYASDEHAKELRGVLLILDKRSMHMQSQSRILSCKWTTFLLLWTHVNPVLFLATLSKIWKMMDIVWQSLLEANHWSTYAVWRRRWGEKRWWGSGG